MIPMKKKERKIKENKKPRPYAVLLRLVIIFIIVWGVTWIPVTERISLDLLPGNDESVRIVLITDLHSCFYGPGQRSLIRRVEKEDPDLILLGGDIFDDKLNDENAKEFVEAVAAEYPCFYVTGNHEFWGRKVREVKEYLEGIGVEVLDGRCSTVLIGNTYMDICGVDDPTYMTMSAWREQLDLAYSMTEESHIKVLLSHRPELAYIYSQYGFDLICAGHAHAGQFRIPFTGKGLFAPDQGYMAGYVSGTYELSGGSIMEVSRGLARESTPAPRFFNHPEVVVLELK
jgi:predicted MPP superfamily phosphohydrolase